MKLKYTGRAKTDVELVLPGMKSNGQAWALNSAAAWRRVSRAL